MYLVPVGLEISFLSIFLLIDKEEEEKEGSLLIFYVISGGLWICVLSMLQFTDRDRKSVV